MHKIISILFSVFIGIVAVGIATPSAHAALEIRDYQSAGDGLLTYDPTTNLEWLDLTVSAGFSYNGAEATFGADGFTHAVETAPLTTLFASAGFISGGSNQGVNHAPSVLLDSLICSLCLPSDLTRGVFGVPDTLLVLVGAFADFGRALDGLGFPSGYYDLPNGFIFDLDASTAPNGHYLYRTAVSAVPVPAALPLMGSGLVLLGLLGWRRKRAAAA